MDQVQCVQAASISISYSYIANIIQLYFCFNEVQSYW